MATIMTREDTLSTAGLAARPTMRQNLPHPFFRLLALITLNKAFMEPASW